MAAAVAGDSVNSPKSPPGCLPTDVLGSVAYPWLGVNLCCLHSTFPAYLHVRAQQAVYCLAKGLGVAGLASGRCEIKFKLSLEQGLVYFLSCDFLPSFLCTWQCFLLAATRGNV